MMSILSLVALTVTSMGELASAGLGPRTLTDSCNPRATRLVDSFVGMYCQNDNTAQFGYNWTWIDLGMCIGNNNGNLTPLDNGNFQSGCSGCHADRSGPEPNPTLDLTCNCMNADKNAITSTMDLDAVLINVDGCLGCYTHMGNKSTRGPV